MAIINSAGQNQLLSTTNSPTFVNGTFTGNVSAVNLLAGYSTTATAAGTTTLTVTSKQQQFFTGATTQTVVLPVTSTLVLGQSYLIVNNSTGVVTVQSSGANTIQAMAAGTELTVTVILTSGTTAASWNASYNTEGITASSFLTDSGTALPSSGAINIKANGGTNNCGTTVSFSGSGSTVLLNFTDSFSNTMIGKSCGTTNFGGNNIFLGANCATANSSGGNNVVIGRIAFNATNTGSNTVAIGYESLTNVISGNHVAVGYKAGFNYSGTDTNNLCLGYNVLGTSGHSNEILIGNSSHTTCFVTGITGVTAVGSPVVVNTTGQLSDLGFGTATQVLTSNGAGVSPTWQAVASTGFVWTGISANQSLVANNGYYVTSGALVLPLPATAAAGTVIELLLAGGTSWQITQGAGQSIHIGNSSTTVGVGGSIASTAAGDSVRILCTVANTTWYQVGGTEGNPTII